VTARPAYLRDDSEDKLRREIVTPEGVPLRFTLAAGGDRAAAFALDMLFLVGGGALLILLLVLAFSDGSGDGSWLQPFIIVAWFLASNFYWSFFEVRWQGMTPGKRIVGIRVIDARGGQLEVGSVLARNLMRELEVWTPLRFVLSSQLLWPGAPGWFLVASGAWSLVFLVLPAFNRDKLRAGDIVGGTRVVKKPRSVLVPDLADRAAPTGKRTGPAPFAFTEAHLDAYGIYELQVLEGLLRSEGGTMAHLDAIETVARKIHAKIRYPTPVSGADEERFLHDFYTALRAHLEKKMLFGQRREDKFARK